MKGIAALCSALFCLSIQARGQVGYDTLSHRPNGPGVWHTHIAASSVLWNINILYNSYHGLSTGTNISGTEVLVRPIDSWLVNDTLVCVVDTVVQSVGNMAIPANKAVLSSHGASKAFLDTMLQQGDTLKLYAGLTGAPLKLKELIGGYPKIVWNGTNYVRQGYQEEGGPSHAFQREPRTAAGFSPDSSTLYLVTVDGRKPSRTILFRIDAFDIDNIQRQMPVSTFSIGSTDTTIGWINRDGVFKGRGSGATKIVASYGKINDTASVRVEQGSGSMQLHSLEAASPWILTGQDIDLTQTRIVSTEEVRTLGRRSLRLDYVFTYDPTKLNFAYLNTDIPVFGVPDSIIIDARSDDASHRIFYYVEDNNGEAFRIYTNKLANRIGAFDTIRASAL